MHYDFDLEIPAITAESDPEEKVCKVTYGILRRVWIYFRGGCADLAHIKIYHGTRQIFPTNPESNYAFDNYVIDFEEYYPILEVPHELTIFGWNEDDTFAHTITIMFLVLHPTTVGRPEVKPTEEEELKELLGKYEIAGGS